MAEVRGVAAQLPEPIVRTDNPSRLVPIELSRNAVERRSPHRTLIKRVDLIERPADRIDDRRTRGDGAETIAWATWYTRVAAAAAAARANTGSRSHGIERHSPSAVRAEKVLGSSMPAQAGICATST